ncbi:MAG: 5-(carboxyamino)imidazole ribonucleotide mutase [Candidatus Omnitrophica bacterium]|nr:5-(carboxyamino)imidazole ribonucleotide mutase [Candidatus Omnitrophota bacterium]
MSKPKVAVVMGSDSDLSTMKETTKILEDFKIPYEVKILSAHRSPDAVTRFAKSARINGFKVIIAGAGGSAALAGVVASHTTLPVIGVPMETNELKGIDSLFSTVQMPSGVPVATVSIGKAGAKNAAFLALEILSLSDKRIDTKLKNFKRSLAARCVL